MALILDAAGPVPIARHGAHAQNCTVAAVLIRPSPAQAPPKLVDNVTMNSSGEHAMDSRSPSPSAGAARAPAAGKLDTREFLSFELGSEEYGIDILKVQEIRGYEKPTRMANVPAFIKGVVNLRGIIVPIIDMRIKFNLATVVYNEFTVVIILNVLGRVLGIVVDGVSDVTTLNAEQIKPAPEFSAQLDTSYVIGLGTQGDRMLILIDIQKLVGGPDLGLAAEAPVALAA
jgi:purine-binding chemotaxis protein CheW